MRPINLVTASYGYGLAVSAMQLTAAYSAIANGGELLQPRLVKALRRGAGAVEPTPGPVKIRRVASRDSIEQVRSMLVQAVTAGTGKNAAVPGYEVAGKTGTSKKIDPETRTYSSADYMASFSGLVPSLNPRFTILVVLDQPQGRFYGGEVAAPVFSEIASWVVAYHGTPKEESLLGRRPGEGSSGGSAR